MFYVHVLGTLLQFSLYFWVPEASILRFWGYIWRAWGVFLRSWRPEGTQEAPRGLQAHFWEAFPTNSYLHFETKMELKINIWANFLISCFRSVFRSFFFTFGLHFRGPRTLKTSKRLERSIKSKKNQVLWKIEFKRSFWESFWSHFGSIWEAFGLVVATFFGHHFFESFLVL